MRVRTHEPRSKNSCFTRFRCFFASTGNMSWTSEVGEAVSFVGLIGIFPGIPSGNTGTPEVDKSMRVCSAICCWSQPTSSCLDTNALIQLLANTQRVNALHSYSVPLRMLFTLKAACSRRPAVRGRGYTVNLEKLIRTRRPISVSYAQNSLPCTDICIIFMLCVSKT
jgi:hypothetical protein